MSSKRHDPTSHVVEIHVVYHVVNGRDERMGHLTSMVKELCLIG